MGNLLGGLVGNLFGGSSTQSTQIITSPPGSATSEFEAFREGPFGLVGGGAVQTTDTKRAFDEALPELVLNFDEQMAALLTSRQIELAAQALQTTEAIFIRGAKNIDNEIFDIVKDRAQILIGGAFPGLFPAGGDPCSDIRRSQDNVEALAERAGEVLSFGGRFEDITGRAQAIQGGPRGLQLFELEKAANDNAQARLQEVQGFLGDAAPFLLEMGSRPTHASFQGVVGQTTRGQVTREHRRSEGIGNRPARNWRSDPPLLTRAPVAHGRAA